MLVLDPLTSLTGILAVGDQLVLLSLELATARLLESGNAIDSPIVSVIWSSCGGILAVGHDNKTVFVFSVSRDADNAPTTLALLHKRFGDSHGLFTRISLGLVAPRRVSALAFAGRDLIAADKTGDVIRFPADREGENGDVIAGHVSIPLDLVVTPDLRYMITADRDDKICVHRYPNAYNIESFCLGHTNYVSSIKVLSNGNLVSASADGSVKLWNYVDGRLLGSLELSTQDPSGIVRSIALGSQGQVAAIVDGDHRVYLAQVVNGSTLQADPREISIPSCAPLAISFDISDRIWVVGNGESGIEVYVIESGKDARRHPLSDSHHLTAKALHALNLQALLRNPTDKIEKDDGDDSGSEDEKEGFKSKRVK